MGLVLYRLRGQGQHRHQATFAVVVRAQHQGHILDGNNDGQRPEKDGQDSVDILWGKGNMPRTKDFLHGVQDTGPDIAVNNTDSAER